VLAGNRLGELDGLAIFQTVFEGLACVAERRLAHGRIQPGCIMLDTYQTPRLDGLGLKRSVTSDDAFTYCMAPEQVRAVGADIKADVYSLGVCLWRALTGRYPFEGEDKDEVRARRVEEDVPDPRSVEPDGSERIARLLSWMCARDPGDRYPTPHGASLDILRIMADRDPGGPGSRLSSPSELVELLEAADERGGAGETPRGLWGRGPAYAYQATYSTQDERLGERPFDSPAVTVGRGKGCELQIDNPLVSREHACIRRIGAHFLVESVSKTNSTTIREVVVKGKSWLKAGQAFVMAEKFHVRCTWRPYAVAAPAAEKRRNVDTSRWVSPPTERIPRELIAKVRRKAAEQKQPELQPTYSQPPTAAWRVPRAYLLHSKAGAETRTSLENPVQIGSSHFCDVRIEAGPDKSAMIVPCREGYRAYNLVSSTPDTVTVNGEPLHDQAALEHGDTIGVAGVELRFLSP